jgi:hypothetical protein
MRVDVLPIAALERAQTLEVEQIVDLARFAPDQPYPDKTINVRFAPTTWSSCSTQFGMFRNPV